LVDNALPILIITALMTNPLYSLRMRADRDGGHCSGAERLAAAGELAALTAELVARALACSGGPPDTVHCTIDRVAGMIPCWPLPAVRTLAVSDWMAGRECAQTLLQRAGVAPHAAAAAMELLAAGPAPGGRVMRGALIVDAASGERLETDPARGVRVSRMDLAPVARAGILAALAAAGLGHPRVAEALVLAGKVLHAPGIVAELCWSDDPEYLAGYVADPRGGYQRITRLKAAGDRYGGRALFVCRSGWDRNAFYAYLERQAVLFDAPGPIAPPQPWRP
jgi:6-carboxyhexanoate--CoA ligase